MYLDQSSARMTLHERAYVIIHHASNPAEPARLVRKRRVLLHVPQRFVVFRQRLLRGRGALRAYFSIFDRQITQKSKGNLDDEKQYRGSVLITPPPRHESPGRSIHHHYKFECAFRHYPPPPTNSRGI